MKKIFTLIVMALVLGAGNMMAEVVTSIGNLTQWKSFVTSVNGGDDYSGKTVTLTADITMETSGFGAQTVGTSDHPFTGTFDGAGYTLTYNNTNLKSLPYCAPFRYIKNATIKNVIVAGEISVQDNNIIGGIVGYVGGTSTSDVSYIDNCISRITLTNSASSGDGRIGGIVGYQLATSGLQITNCLVEGTINSGRSQAAGVMGYKKNGASLTVTSIFLTSTITGKVNTFVKSEGGEQTITKCYTTIESPEQGTNATTAKLESGEIAYELQNSQATQYWGQKNLNKSTAEAFPKLSSANADKVIKLTMSNGSSAEYANADGAMPSPVDKKALSFNNGSGGDPFTSFSNDATMSRCFNKYTLIVPSAGACTLVLPVDVAELPENVTAYELSYTSGDKLTATKVNSIKANKPVLINAAAGSYVFVSANDSEITYDTENAQNNGVLYGIYTDTYKYVPQNSYVLQNGTSGLGFYKVADADKIKITSFRAYATFTYAAGSRDFLDIDFNGDITGIKDVKTQLEDSNAPIYNLSGQRVGNDYKGVVIQNGKKFVVK